MGGEARRSAEGSLWGKGARRNFRKRLQNLRTERGLRWDFRSIVRTKLCKLNGLNLMLWEMEQAVAIERKGHGA